MIQTLRERKIIFYSNKNNKEFYEHYEQMQKEGWKPIDERSIVDDGYEIEYEKWHE